MNKLRELTKDFLRYLLVEKGASPLTVREYTRYLREFADWVDKNYPDFTIEKLDLSIVRGFRVYLSERENRRGGKLGKSAQNHYIITLRSFLIFLRKNDIKTLDPVKIELPTIHPRSLRFLNTSDIEKLMAMPILKTPDGLRDRTILELFYSTGLRVSELFRLNRDSVNLETREFSIMGKGSKTRLVFISDEAVKWLKRYLEIRTDGFKPLFIRYSREINTDEEKMRLSVSTIERMVKGYALCAGIKVRVTPHTLRHSFATNLLNNGANLIMVKEFLGHSSVATTEIYTHVTNDQLREAHKKFHGNNQ